MDIDCEPTVSVMSKLKKLFSVKDSVVQQLLAYKQCDEKEKDEWVETAVGYLVKRLAKRKGSTKELIHVLSHPDQPSNCITIPRSLDGRIQVSYIKGMSHLIYCRIWRWPHLQSHHQLTALNTCKYSFEAKLKEVCINPYHYKVIGEANLQPVHVPRHVGSSSNKFIQEQQRTSFECFRAMNTPTCSPGSFGSSPINPHSFTYDRTLSTSSSSDENSNQYTHMQITNWAQIRYEEVSNWGRVAYYERNCRVGEIFLCNTSSVTVDGFTNPHTSGRFCLGKLSNVKRNSSIEQTRQQIGNGLQLVYAGGFVYAENKSNVEIFVQSRNCNLYNGFSLNTVCKIPPACSLCIFSNHHFAQLLSQSVYQGYECVYELTKMCTIRLSFAIGWGTGYVCQDVISTPCWIELHLEGPLSWLDRVLSEIGSPKFAISSVS